MKWNHFVHSSVLSAAHRRLINASMIRSNATVTATIPHAPNVPVLGTLPYQLLNGGQPNLHTYVDKLHKKLGPIFYDGIPGQSALFVSDPLLNLLIYQTEGPHPKHYVPPSWTLYLEREQKQRGIFFMDGEEWKKNRKVLGSIMLHPQASRAYIGIFNQITSELMKVWEKQGTIQDVEYQLYSWNIESIGAYTVGKRLGYIEKLLDESSRKDFKEMNFVKAIYDIFLETMNMQNFPPHLVMKFNLPVWKRFSKAVGVALDLGNQYVDEAIQDYHKNGPTDIGIINSLMKNGSVDEHTIKILLTDLILAATDTTSQTAQWILYELGRNPDVAEKARQELREVVGSPENLNPTNMEDLKYIRAIMKEALRMYPVATFLTRQIVAEVEWENYIIPKDTWVITSLMTMGRSEEYFSDPLQFKPERWLKETNGLNSTVMTLQNRASVPWGLGIRNCIGKRQATSLLTVFISQILFNFKWNIEEETKPILRMITTPDKPLVINMQKITN